MAAEVIRNVVIRVTVETGKSNIAPPDLSPATKAVSDFQKEVSNAISQGAKAVAEQAASVKKLEEGFDNAAAAASNLRDEVESIGKVDPNVDVPRFTEELGGAAKTLGSDLTQAGEGAFVLARGLALVSTTSEEDLGKVIKKIAAVQGAFDVFKGTLTGLSAGINILKTLNSTTAITAAVNGTLAASNAKVATTGAAAATSMFALNASTGGILLVVGSLVAGLAALVLALRGTEDELDSVGETGEEAFDRIAASADAAREATDKLRQGLRSARDEALERELVTARTPEDVIAIRKLQEARAGGAAILAGQRAGTAAADVSEGQERLGLQGRIISGILSQVSMLESKLREIDKLRVSLDLSGEDPGRGAREIQKKRQAVLEKLAPVQERLNLFRENELIIQKQLGAALSVQVSNQQELVDATRKQFTAARKLRDEEERLLETRVDEARQAKRDIDTATERAANEQARVEKLQAQQERRGVGQRTAIDTDRLLELQAARQKVISERGTEAADLENRLAELREVQRRGDAAIKEIGDSFESSQETLIRLSKRMADITAKINEAEQKEQAAL
jgi:hypothetical protein